MDLNKIVHELAEKGFNVRFVKEDMKFDGATGLPRYM